MDPKRDLELIVERNTALKVAPQGPDGGRPMRKSAVLILFGRLDNIMAEPSAPSSVETSVPEDLDVLLIRRADRSSHHPGQVAFPGGGIDPEDAGPEAAALREAVEETGLNPDDVEIIGTLEEVPLPVSNNLVTPVIAWWKRSSQIAAVDHHEAVEVFRAPVAEMLDPEARGTGKVSRPPLVHYSDAFILSDRCGGHTVWGFTGTLLSIIFREAGWSVPWDQSRIIPIKLI